MTDQTEEKTDLSERSTTPERATGPEKAEATGPLVEAGQIEVAKPADATETPERTGGAEPVDQPERSEPQDAVPSPRPAGTSSAALPEPEPAGTPAPAPEPASEAEPAPASEQEPAPVPVPGSAPAPASAPVPTSAPESAPVPQAAPALASASASASEAASELAPESAPAVPKDRRVLRATLRWTAALLTFAVVGAGTAYGITGMARTDVPGLSTVSDGRWEYPTLTKPPLPSGSPGPLAADNKAGSHYVDLRALVLPAPKGATADKALRGTDGWLPTKDLLAEYAQKTDRKELEQKFSDNALRHIAARGWTTPDGTHTRIYLLQFDTAAVVDSLFGKDIAPYGGPGYELRGAPDSVADEGFPSVARLQDISASVYVESKPYGAEQVRHAYLGAGDVLALVVQSRKGTANPVPFQQTVTLQSQLLG